MNRRWSEGSATQAFDPIDNARARRRCAIERIFCAYPIELTAGARDFPDMRNKTGGLGRVRINAAEFDGSSQIEDRLIERRWPVDRRIPQAMVHHVARDANRLLLRRRNHQCDGLANEADHLLCKQRLIHRHPLIVNAALADIFVSDQIDERA
jgi:hypothetical protein